ncbi:class I adenylate-forming enzyme family protein [Microbulbifer halophilus]|uniref:AMP-binding protein n=1 Tax=Microbulbifer halophilus TaxID=453963 RepID=A0ABW5EAV6_9GAMM|nr:class I adenylate-forming enzyme family protein [Microbulbifer halophilus]MCW8126115.1 class I adenylate-forming enzyme family protein [Microbulbifer halophilus]
MSYALTAIFLLLLGYLSFVAVRLGYIGRLALLASWDDRIDRALEFAARRHGERKLIELAQPLAWHDERHWNAPQILDMAGRLAACWHHLGARKGDRIAIYKANQFDYFLFSVAALRLGAIAVPINVNVAPEIAAGYMERLAAKLLVSDGAGWQKLSGPGDGRLPATVEQVVLTDAAGHSDTGSPPLHRLQDLLAAELPAAPQPDRGPADPMYIVHTSGTTGVPKGVILKAEGIAQSLRSIVLFNPVSRRDLACFALPLNHQVSHLYLHGVLLMGVRCIVDSELAAPGLVRQLERRKPTVFFGFPITYTRLMQAGALDLDLSSIRIWGTTADASHEVQQRAFIPRGSFFTRLGIPKRGSLFVDGLGSSEVGIAALLRIATPWTQKFARRVGRKTPLGPQIKIADTDGTPVPRGEVGRLMIKGKSMFDGYWNAHDVFYAATCDGWWFTGDMVRLGEDGEVVHLDREVDVIHTDRGPAYTLPLEEIVLKQSGVLDTCVFGVRPQPESAEVPAAVVALHGDAPIDNSESFRHELNRQLPEAQRLAYLWLVDWNEFPIGATGKTLKRRLREEYNGLLQAHREEAPERTPCEIREPA